MAQNKNGPVIALAIFMLLSVLFAVGWYFSYSDNQTNSAKLDAATKKAGSLNTTISQQIDQLSQLKELIGRAPIEDPEGDPASTGDIVASVRKILTDQAADGSQALPNLEGALLRKASESFKNSWTATNRKAQLDVRSQQLADTIVSKDGEIVTHKVALEQAEQQLVEQQAIHSEETARMAATNKKLRTEKSQAESEHAAYRVAKEREIEDLTNDYNLQRHALVALRKRLREKEDPSFSTPDGQIETVDHNSRRCYINLGKADGLRVGVTFSVYKQKNSGVGRRTVDDIKGKIEIVDILGPHRAEGRIIKQAAGSPVASDDPIYSPIFQAGQAMEIVVCGRIARDGMNRAEFRRTVAAAGAKIVVEVDDDGHFTDGKGQNLSSEEAPSRITSRTRYIVLADLGDEEGSENEVLQEIYKRIRENTSTLTREAENHGVYELGLDTFLEHIGYSPKQLAWTPESPFGYPGKLSNGAKSAAVGGTVGRRQSSAAVSGLFSKRRRSSTSSNSAISGAYRQ